MIWVFFFVILPIAGIAATILICRGLQLLAELDALDEAIALDESLRCPGDCHAGILADFDHYCDINEIPVEDTPQAFADWMFMTSGWAGEYCRLVAEV